MDLCLFLKQKENRHRDQKDYDRTDEFLLTLETKQNSVWVHDRK